MELIQHPVSIIKIVVMPDFTQSSPFQGFGESLLDDELLQMLSIVNLIPKNIYELFSESESIANQYHLRKNHIFLLNKSSLEFADFIFNSPFVVIIHSIEDSRFVNGLSKKFKCKPILCSNMQRAHINISSAKSKYSFDNLLYKKALELDRSLNSEVRHGFSSLTKRQQLLSILDATSHLNNATKPNEVLIENLGFKFEKSDELFQQATGSKRIFIDKIIDSINYYFTALKIRGVERPDEVIAFTPGLYHFYYEREDKTIPAIKERFGFSDFHFLIDGILKNPNYSSTPIIGEIVEEIASVIQNPVFKSIASTRMYELKLTTLAISFLALQKRVPAIRLPNGVNHFLGKLQKLESISIDIGINDSEFQVKFKGLNTLMRRRLGKKLRDYISVNFNSISLVCDTPLDWFRFGELPLMLTHEISRINSTPGNILLQNASIYPMVNMNASELKKILVLRSFSFGEDIKFTLERALDVVLGNYKDIDIQIVDIQSEAEMISALNQFDGAVLVMDCHGDHGGTKKNGWLHLGEDEVDIWHLPKDVRIPPIVILSACLTSAISGSHASVANGFLKNGAVSVVGTLLPVNAIDSGVFVGRLLYRLTEFPKVLKKEFSHVTLRTLISLFLRMSYTTDVLRAFQISAVINPDDYERIHSLVNNEINSFNSDWNERMIDELFKSSHYSKERVRKFIDENCFFTETMCYSQIGFPECISINVRR